MTFIDRMMPGVEPYTTEEIELLHALVGRAAQAELEVDLDELEEYAAQMAFGMPRGSEP